MGGTEIRIKFGNRARERWRISFQGLGVTIDSDKKNPPNIADIFKNKKNLKKKGNSFKVRIEERDP